MDELLRQLEQTLDRVVVVAFGVEITVGRILAAVGAVILAWAVAMVVLQVMRRATRRFNPESAGPPASLERAVWLLALVVGLLGAVRVLGIDVRELLDARLIEFGDTTVTIAVVLAGFTVLIGAYFVSQILQRALRRVGSRHDELARSSLTSLGRLLHYFVMSLGAVVALETIGFDLKALVAVGGVVAIAIGFAMQNVVANFVSGVILLVERSIKPNDVLEIEDRVVRVVALGIRSTQVRTRNGEDLIVPNSIIVQSIVKNFTHADTMLRISADVGVAYGSDLDAVFDVLRAVAKAFPGASKSRPASVVLLQFGSSSIDFRVRVWIKSPWGDVDARSDLLLMMWRALREADITIAFPQLDVHLDEPVVAALGSSR